MHTYYYTNRTEGRERQIDLSTAEIRWMAAYSPHLDFSFALHQAEKDENATQRPQVQGAGA